MNTNFIISELKKNKNIFQSLLENLDKEVYLWKQNNEKWCLLEIVCHLYDEERDDFGVRLKAILEDENAVMAKTDPIGWMTSRKYMEQDYNAMLEKFLQERDNTIAYFENLENPKWLNAYPHPTYGPLYAKMFFINWLAHDYLHIRQITKLKFDYLSASTGDSLHYAGEW
ncbi:MAG: DinB family protein [Bacteroidetes bacterium]|nr:DinB family protein [Bacteroidota bacterium]MBX7046724.1 DinB family protein [Ignavibacteria bacterium]